MSAFHDEHGGFSMSLHGTDLILELRENSGLDQDFFDGQMEQLMKTYSLNPETLGLEQLREVLSDYLQALILEEENKEQSAS
jgi:hypothetical protein